jgi:HSP20 family protein
MSLMRRDPWRELVSFRDGFNRLFDETVGRRFPVSGLGEWKPQLDVIDKDAEFILKVDLPGYDPDNLKINVTENSVSIQGEVKEENEIEENEYFIRERNYGSFARTVPLSAAVKPDEAKAVFKNGVLTLTIPKAEQPKGRIVDIETE